MIRCRFAPSPTGHLHVGGVRTALFNWLFSRSQKGQFILRIEDTDTERSEKRFEDQILDSMNWCGFEWEEGPDKGGPYGPYRQSERKELGIYDKYVEELIKSGKAYYAIYKKGDNENVIETSETKPMNLSDDYTVTVKIKVPKEGTTEFKDLLKGDMTFKNEIFDDFVIVKSNGYPTYNFAVVVDDHLMEISHVFRGEDHLSNTPRQIMIYRALDWEPPLFMHIPLILGNDKAPLSKRHGHTSVNHFKNEGYLNISLMNYLALLGWAVDQEIFDFHTKIEDFAPASISNKGVVFDYEKLEWINGKHIRELPIEKLLIEYESWLKETAKNESLEKILSNPGYSENVIKISREKINTLAQLYDFSLPFFVDKIEYDSNYIDKFLKKEWSLPLIKLALEEFKNNEDWSWEGTERIIRKIAEEKITSKKNTFQTLRGAVTGKLVTPGLFETYSVLGKEQVIERLTSLLRLLTISEDDE